jgi:hypothetical protein
MTQDEISELARKAGLFGRFMYEHKDEIETFAKLVAAKEQEDIIQIIKETPFSNWFQADVIEAIRARGEQV